MRADQRKAKMKLHRTHAAQSDEKRSPMPLRSQSPNSNSKGGRNVPNISDTVLERNPYSLKCMATTAAESLKDVRDQSIPGGGFRLEYEDKMNTAAKAMRASKSKRPTLLCGKKLMSYIDIVCCRIADKYF